MIPIFDSLSHPTLSGSWLDGHGDASVQTLVDEMARFDFSAACAVGLAGVNDYDHERFARLCQPFPQLVPIAGVNPLSPHGIDTELDVVRDLGYRGVKLHPRLSGFSLTDPRFVATLLGAERRGLAVFLCTYFHSPIATYPDRDPFYDLVAALKATSKLRLILIHGGDVELMRYMQLARHTPRLLLDVSFVLMKYRGSSLDADLRYLMSGFNHRMCIGVDHPEFLHGDVRDRFEELTRDLADAEKSRVAYRNLQQFLDVGELGSS